MNQLVCRVCLVEKSEKQFFKASKTKLSTDTRPYFDKICRSCKHDKQQARRKAFKQWAVHYKGGKCIVCGYNKCMAAMDFHHLDPSQKEFGLGSTKGLITRKRAIPELDKCVLLCRNCHMEVHHDALDLQPYLGTGTSV